MLGIFAFVAPPSRGPPTHLSGLVVGVAANRPRKNRTQHIMEIKGATSTMLYRWVQEEAGATSLAAFLEFHKDPLHHSLEGIKYARAI